jgi:uncharacterized protein (DUF2235 family)
MKRLIVCCDGTWNTPDQTKNDLPCPTNVVKLFNAVAEEADGVKQLSYYHPGVGTEGSGLSRALGGAYGAGLGKNIVSAYAWLAAHYEPNDQIFLFGFSRGAFTVRSLGGFLARCGLLDLGGLSPKEAFARVQHAYEDGYRAKKAAWKDPAWGLREEAPVPIHFIGVWDTVGALGIPDDLALLNLLDRPENWRFHDTHLDPSVHHARQALAIDEQRASFAPTLWTDPGTRRPYPNDERVKQLWFPGVHCDVGGGYYECELSDVALKWMFDEAEDEGLGFRENLVAQLRPNPNALMHDSLSGVFRVLRTCPRNIPCLPDPAWYHASAIERSNDPPIGQAPYHPCRMLTASESATLPVYAVQHWNSTGLYLEAGATYQITATGEWLDANIPSGPAGMDDGKFHIGEAVHMAASFLGSVENIFKKVSGNDRADFWGTRRIESMPWFALVGVIANGGVDGPGAPGVDGSPHPHQTFLIGEGPVALKVQRPGYLYAFANDAWAFYGNNRGSVSLTVKRT